MQEDLKNYMRIKLDPRAAVLLKKGVLPRFFDCQSDRKRASSMPIRPAIKKLKKLRILQEINEKEIKKNFSPKKDLFLKILKIF